MKPVIYVIANKSLNMSAGKLAAQVGHAVAGVVTREPDILQKQWQTSLQRWVIILEGQDDIHLSAIREYFQERHEKTFLVIDEGVNEVRPFSFTALGIPILDKDSPEAAYLKDLPLYTQRVAPRLEAVPVRWWNRWRSVV